MRDKQIVVSHHRVLFGIIYTNQKYLLQRRQSRVYREILKMRHGRGKHVIRIRSRVHQGCEMREKQTSGAKLFGFWHEAVTIMPAPVRSHCGGAEQRRC